jgi:hypothetical protein
MNYYSQIRDSTFPFTVGEELMARIEGGKIIIEKKMLELLFIAPPKFGNKDLNI